ncbi:Asp-tRNA(Asn)/Glu-tRNA(Gln) amidotransferase subunit GatA [Actinomyces minihominis]|uniref:Asp-tRNA(Asn)/Glu-tRNA(Gln) amidotransferase subunit GatA n=1 Tax=Actinomyces minihominis TaxID=2002838 RepID=UPI000C06F2C3|nr:Asp-tRNA(Asn)/Glu-tRNA(Gln) amidotransferase subunit GatA [Actinomyces minihominis]
MTDLMKLSALEMAEALREGRVTSTELVEASLARIEELNPSINAFLAVDAEGALATAQEVDELRAQGAELHPLAGVPVAVKDNIVTSGLETTAASRILEGWVPPYDATVVARLKAARLPIVGKTNLDEFAMGSGTEFSAFGPTKNPWDLKRAPGGSGGGSAAAVASYMVPLALGSDTGGSIRQPAMLTGTVGVKPTYGRISRYGAIALASSLDQVGPVARNLADAAALQDIIAGHDPKDATSLNEEHGSMLQVIETAGGKNAVEGLRVAVVNEIMEENYDEDVRANFERTLAELEAAGAKIVHLSLPSIKYAFPTYYMILPAEASSNLARFDGIRYGTRWVPDKPNPTVNEVMAYTRDNGFGPEVKRRIIMGTRVLRAGNYDAYFGAALRMRTLIREDLERLFEQADVYVSPTALGTAFPFEREVKSPVEAYLNDVATIPANLAGLPALSIPNGIDANGLPTAIQVVAHQREDALLYTVASAIEELVAEDVVAPRYLDDYSTPAPARNDSEGK